MVSALPNAKPPPLKPYPDSILTSRPIDMFRSFFEESFSFYYCWSQSH